MSKGEGESIDEGLANVSKVADHSVEGVDYFDGETIVDAAERSKFSAFILIVVLKFLLIKDCSFCNFMALKEFLMEAPFQIFMCIKFHVLNTEAVG